jgi:PAS domain S-box-containing protein
MSAPIRILIVGGTPEFEAAVSDQLQAVGIYGVFYRATNGGDYVRLLKVGVDVIIAEEQRESVRPSLNTMSALSLLNEQNLDVSFLVVADSIGEEAVVDYMRQGADDVIFKERLSRLGPAITRALADRETRYARRRAEAAHRYSETRFRTISGLISDFAYALRVTEGGIMAWEWMTQMTDRISGLRLDDLPDQGGWSDLVHPDDRPVIERHYATLCAGGASEVEFRIVTGSGGVLYLRDHCQAVPDDWGLLIFGAVRDITEFREASLALRASEERFRQLFEHAADAVFVNDRSGRFLDANQLAVDTLGYSREELCQLATRDLNPILTPDRIDSVWQGIVAGGPRSLEGVLYQKDGSALDVDVRLSVFESNGDELMLAVVRDIRERKRAEEALRQSEEQHRRIVETSSEGIVMTDVDGQITFANERHLEMFGYTREELMGRPTLDFMSPEAQSLVASKMSSQGVLQRQEYSLKLQRKDGSDIWVVVSSSPLHGPDGLFQGRLAMITDVTERKRAEEELFQAQKLESVGRLAAGIAHEINTPIQFVGDNVHFLRDSFASLKRVVLAARELRQSIEADEPTRTPRADDGATVGGAAIEALRAVEEEADLDYLTDEVPRAIEQTLDGIERVASIVRAMKEFAHPDGTDLVAVDLNQALRSTLTVARNELKYVADVETDFAELPLVPCQPSAINQVFLNLLVNAAQAIEDSVRLEPGRRGTIRVLTSRDDDEVLVEVSDTGCGIPDDVQAKVFDQFFTTKSVGRGTGQGLALAHRVVVEQHGGSLSFQSEVGRGTTFIVRLPLHESCQGRPAGILPDIA